MYLTLCELSWNKTKLMLKHKLIPNMGTECNPTGQHYVAENR